MVFLSRTCLTFDRLQNDEDDGDEEEWVAEPAPLSQNNRKKSNAAKLKLKNKRVMAKKSRRQN